MVALCVCAGLGYVSAARALDVPAGTVRSRLSRTRKNLQRLALPSDERTGTTSAALREEGRGIAAPCPHKEKL
ncbi:hypothetical protein [Streptomyces sp. NPDC058701]|uniref:hypothetical protein n=1 Tax=Streptomyces sp. NPDC058701 TaxID=3346608 RepID=UPI00365FE542